MEQSVDREKKKFLKKISILATFGSLLFGYDSGVINGSLTFMSRKDQLNLTPLSEGLVTSSLLLGAAFGAVLWGRFADKYGRKKILKILAAIFFFSTIGCSVSPNSTVIIICRFIVGLGVGGVSVVVPTLLAEMAPTKIRGSLVSQDQLMIVTGQLLAYVFNSILGNISSNPGIWRYMIALASIPAVVLWIGMFVVPETPRWLAANGKVAQALEVLRQTRDDAEAEADLKAIEKNIEDEKHLDKATFKDLGTPWIRHLVFVGIILSVIQQIAGINVIMYYGTTVLEHSGFGVKTALIANVANGCMSVIASWFYMHYLANRCRRRPLLIFGYVGSTVTLLVMGIVSRVLVGSAILPYVVVVLTMIYLAIFQSTLGPLTWLLLSEIFPLRVRGMGYGIATFFNWISDFGVGLGFPLAIASIGLSNTFFVFVGFGIICIVCSSAFVPETFGKSLEQLEEQFRNRENSKVTID
ncbi:major inositol transporter-like SP family MFS transporter [Clostridium algifaecis]|uniref:Major inositol transporter-like SP family MFS transporter n=1 Tax=Clostridium algifaecis TaxID=1472040 RepID=A0ABS4KNA0_9CLOT|nr:sugar porter family MFS transporter [Clostridium algifaecis]MBP2031518.1 major inositol transporter-like SP family MFS transporter [Clostridium algifaecis]